MSRLTATRTCCAALLVSRGPTFASGNAGVTSALFDLLVVSGGTEGLLAALQVADAAHASGEGSSTAAHTPSEQLARRQN